MCPKLNQYIQFVKSGQKIWAGTPPPPSLIWANSKRTAIFFGRPSLSKTIQKHFCRTSKDWIVFGIACVKSRLIPYRWEIASLHRRSRLVWPRWWTWCRKDFGKCLLWRHNNFKLKTQSNSSCPTFSATLKCKADWYRKELVKIELDPYFVYNISFLM